MNGSPPKNGDDPDGDDEPQDSDKAEGKICACSRKKCKTGTSYVKDAIEDAFPDAISLVCWPHLARKITEGEFKKALLKAETCFLLKSAFTPLMHAEATHSLTCCAVLCLIDPLCCA